MEAFVLWLTLLTAVPTSYGAPMGEGRPDFWLESDAFAVPLTKPLIDKLVAAFGAPIIVPALKGFAPKREGWFFVRKSVDTVGIMLDVRRAKGAVVVVWWSVGPADPKRWEGRWEIEAALRKGLTVQP